MKTLSVLFTIALLVAANRLAVHLRRTNNLPLRPTRQEASVEKVHSTIFKTFTNN